MEKLNEKILKYCGIYKTNKPYENIDKALKKKKELEKLTGLKIEKAYIFGDSYWGKEETNSNPVYCFLVDERLKTIDKVHPIVQKYVKEKRDVSILFWSLCQFEKRKQSKGELDYYIANYGYLIYDSKKETEIDERVKSTTYANVMRESSRNRKYFKSNENDILMKQLLEIYILKIGYFVDIDMEISLKELIEYIGYINNDNKVKEILTKYVKEKDKQVKKEICDEFEQYITKIKQEKTNFKLPNRPTMKVYEKKQKEFNEKGVLDIKTLTKEDEYIMYVLEGKFTHEIAQLYGVEASEITKKNNSWKIRLREKIISDEELFETVRILSTKHVYKNEDAISVIKKVDNFPFQRCIDSILKFMEAGETYLLKEFWKFTYFEKSAEEIQMMGNTVGTWYRASLATSFLKNNGLIEEVEFKKYKITKLGRKLVTNNKYYSNRKIDIMYILEKLRKINLLGIDYILTDDFERKNTITPNYIQEIEKVNKREIEIDTLEIPNEIKANCKVKKYKSKIRERSKVNTSKNVKNKNKLEISDYAKSKLGIEGEKYIYRNLILNNAELLQNLEIRKNDYEKIIFYNINYNQLQEDQSIGHGCDIEIILKNKEHLYLEVKTSYDNIDYYSMTYNEYKCNIENQDKYFVIKVNNFKYIKKDESKINVTIIKNPYKIFMENTDILKTITFF